MTTAALQARQLSRPSCLSSSGTPSNHSLLPPASPPCRSSLCSPSLSQRQYCLGSALLLLWTAPRAAPKASRRWPGTGSPSCPTRSAPSRAAGFARPSCWAWRAWSSWRVSVEDGVGVAGWQRRGREACCVGGDGSGSMVRAPYPVECAMSEACVQHVPVVFWVGGSVSFLRRSCTLVSLHRWGCWQQIAPGLPSWDAGNRFLHLGPRPHPPTNLTARVQSPSPASSTAAWASWGT